MARTSSLNCLSCKNPYQTPDSLNCLPPFCLKTPFFTETCFVASPPQKIGSDVYRKKFRADGNGLCSRGVSRETKRPIEVKLEKPRIEGGKPIKAVVLLGVSIGCFMGCFWAHLAWWKTAPLKRAIHRTMSNAKRNDAHR